MSKPDGKPAEAATPPVPDPVGGGTPEAGPDASEAARFFSYLAIAAACLGLFISALDLPSSRWEPLGAGSFPQLILVALIALCLAGMVQSLRSLAGTHAFGRLARAVPVYFRSRRLVVALFLGLALYLASMRLIGFGLSTFLFLLGSCLLLAPRNTLAWSVSLALAVIFSFGLEWLFAEIFHVFLPRARWSLF